METYIQQFRFPGTEQVVVRAINRASELVDDLVMSADNVAELRAVLVDVVSVLDVVLAYNAEEERKAALVVAQQHAHTM